MADNNYRTYRRADPYGRGNAAAPGQGAASDPLAELARLIGQSDPFAETGRQGPQAEPHDDGATGAGWAAERYAEPDRYGSSPAADSRGAQEYYDQDDASVAHRYSGHDRPFDDPRYAAQDGRYADEAHQAGQRDAMGLGLDGERDYAAEQDEHDSQDAAVPGYGRDDYADQVPNRSRRGGLVVVMAVLGLAVVGTAGAFGYRAMFGGSMVPSLPPIIKASDRPDKVMPPADSKAGKTSYDRIATLSQDEKVVPREEQPVEMKEPSKAAPRIISTIPVVGGSPPVAPLSAPPPAPAAPALTAAAPPAPPPAVPTAEPKKIRTVVIRPDQAGGVSPPAAAAALPPPAARNAASPPTARRTAAPSPSSGNEPLALVPQGDAAGPAPAAAPLPPPARTRTAARNPAPSAAAAIAPGSGGYVVQVSSQRSEAEAQSAFKSLQARFPNQLAGREPVVRRADLGSKGVYYRAMVGPFGSMEEAAGLCSSLKAAGGNCIVQKN